jgi:hypothetical protein
VVNLDTVHGSMQPTLTIFEKVPHCFLLIADGTRSMTPDPSILVLFYNYKTWRTFLETKSFLKRIALSRLLMLILNLNLTMFIISTANCIKIYYDHCNSFTQWNPFSDYMQTPTVELKLKNDFKIHIAVYPISPKV